MMRAFGVKIRTNPRTFLPPLRKRPGAGFTILELSVIVLVTGLILLWIISMYNLYKKADYLAASQKRQAIIDQAIRAFFAQNGYFPCPAGRSLPHDDPKLPTSIYGRGDHDDPLGNVKGMTPDAVNTDCSVAPTAGNARPQGARNPSEFVRIGAVPVRSLGLPDNFINNLAGYQYTYAVTESVAKYDLVHPPTTTSPKIDLEAGQIDIRYPGPTSGSMVDPVGSGLYVLIDHGPKGFGAWSQYGTAPPPGRQCSNAPPNEQRNCDDDPIFYYGSSSTYSN